MGNEENGKNPTLGDGGRRRWLPRGGSLSRILSLPVREFSSGEAVRSDALSPPQSDDGAMAAVRPARRRESSSPPPFFRDSVSLSPLFFCFCFFPFMEKEEKKPCVLLSVDEREDMVGFRLLG